MKTISSWLVPASLALCALLVVGALGWVTRSTLAAERERAHAEIRADMQERTRLALWRMDSFGAALLLDESGFPNVESRLPVKLRFSVSTTGELQTQESDPNFSELKKTIGSGSNALQSMRKIIRMPEPTPSVEEAMKKSEAKMGYSYKIDDRLEPELQENASWNEQAVRSKAVQSTLQNRVQQKLNVVPAPSAQASKEGRVAKFQGDIKRDFANASLARQSNALELSDVGADLVAEAVMGQPHVGWVDGLLLLTRRVSEPSQEKAFDGAWIDDVALREILLNEVADLFSTASLIPANGASSDGMVLASFPFRLDVPSPVAASIPLRKSTVVSLAMSWAAALIALVATMWLVRGVMRLSERRASFVSAVTHELRTPLTTFRLYSDMLESGAVKEEKRSSYLRVLTREADRLSHLVENVLAFSRIERGNARSQVREIDADELLESVRDRLETRLTAVGLHLAIDSPAGLRLRADHTAVEHILFNLIDNAAKYAADSEPPVVTITATRVSGFVCLRICDYGPGIARSEIHRIFRPFHKSAHEAAETKPGVGLGLALSQRLAKEQGGQLNCVPSSTGACFELRLPVA